MDYKTISEINKYIKSKFDTDDELKHVLIKGEISNYKHHTRGHLYFTLKDETSRLSAVMFEFNAKNLTFIPEDGMNVLVEGKINVYEANGAYQIYIEKMSEDGIGNLYLKYEKLKKELSSLGYFDQSNKKKIPKFPNKIGIITASTGAAIKDILSTIKRRYPICETILFPSLVQGEGAKDSIVKQINKANEFNDIDLLIVGRGGGSIEDLWAFNERIVAEAIYNSSIPIISAVGHEVDFTIADFVSDLRAPTPTGAAEMAVPNMIDIITYINQVKIRANESIKNNIKKDKEYLKSLIDSYVLKNPLTLYEIKEQKLSNYIDIINNRINIIMDKNITRFNHVLSNNIIKNPMLIYLEKQNNYNLIINKLELLNPLNVLKKGYSVVKKSNKIISNIKDVNKDDILNIKLNVGEIVAKVEGIK